LEQWRGSVEGLEMNWNGKSVLMTGHTGFKGSWLSLWLQQLGADLCGIALPPPPRANLFQDAEVARGMRSVMGDVRDLRLLKQTFLEHRPEIVFHLAAQPIVRLSYENPLDTYSTNVMGTVSVLEAARHSESVRAIVVVTSDKCYENREWTWPYRETDRLGGYDPYSNSKACVELVVSAYRDSFFNPADFSRHGVAIASVRAGNVIGGGDWSEDRLVPDIIRAFMEERPVRIRHPKAIRPWQHVLEPLRGYLAVTESLRDVGSVNGEGWNFGPDQSDAQPVEWMVRELARFWGAGARWTLDEDRQPHEAQNLKLDCSKAEARLRWRPALRLPDALAMTAAWYRARMHGQDMNLFTKDQIGSYAERCQADAELQTESSGVQA
jgi:CDP-glucose 4,6-dehydratase